MNAKQLIETTKKCVSNHWQNSDLPRNVEVLFEVVAEHFENCEDCRNQFDAEEYTSEMLIDFSSEMHLSNTKLEDWTCQNTQPYFCDKCKEMTPQLLINTEFKVFQCMDCGENNTFSEGN